ncbi:MAG: hypothetical protein ACLPPF_01120 [Rhodomicrobium sp.]
MPWPLIPALNGCKKALFMQLAATLVVGKFRQIVLGRSPSSRGAFAPKQSRSRKPGASFWIATAAEGRLAMTGVRIIDITPISV